jgi:hypothetical protein
MKKKDAMVLNSAFKTKKEFERCISNLILKYKLFLIIILNKKRNFFENQC